MNVFQTLFQKNNNDDIRNNPRRSIDSKRSKFIKITNAFDKIKPADPLINRKKIHFKPIKYPFVNKPVLQLPHFNNKTISHIQNFEILPNQNNSSINNINNVNVNNSKDYHIKIYINSSKMISKLIYARNPKDKEGFYTIDNIINLDQINETSGKRSIINNTNLFNVIENLNKFGLSLDNIINFESNFESGNLQLAYLINSQEEELNSIENNNKSREINNYQLFLQNDTNTNGHTQWFFFRITNGKKGQKIKLNIMNFQRKKSKYSQGLKIWYFSKRKKEEKKIGWHHTKENVEYNQNFLYNYNQNKKNYYYTLSFEYTFEYDNDEIYFANSIPFTYTDMIKDLNNYTIKENETYNYYERKILCTTITGNDVDYFIINNDSMILNIDKEKKKVKKGIVFFARQHPAETVSSYVLKGAYEFLMGFSDEAKYLRDNYIVKIIPMVNVDGVICGNTRTSLSGCDLNRRWINPNDILHPEIYHLKELIMNFNKNIDLEYIIDFHGHFGTFNSFFYANHNENDIKYCKYFPFICGKISNIISFEKSCFKMPKYKRGTGRINLFQELDNENVFTLETSYFGCNQGKYINQYFNIEMLKEIGKDICLGIILYHYNSNLKQGIKEINPKLNLDYIYNIDEYNKEFDEYILLLNKKLKEGGIKNDNDELDDDDDISDSESEPSRDNLDEEEIKKLFPFFQKKKNFRRKKLKSIDRQGSLIKESRIFKLKHKIYDGQKNQTLAVQKSEKQVSYPMLGNFKTILTVNAINNNSNKKKETNSSEILIKNRLLKFYRISKININSNSTVLKIYEEKQTQTEEKFFMFHWKKFIGIYKIVTAKITDNRRISLGFPLLLKHYQIKYKKKKSSLKSSGSIVSTSLQNIILKDNQKNKNNNSITKIGRNESQLNGIFHSYYDKTDYIKSIIIKNEYNKLNNEDKNNQIKTEKDNKIILVNENYIQGSISNRIDNNKKRTSSMKKLVTRFVSGNKNIKKNDFLNKYLVDEKRIINC